jgi:acyl dehydratase
VPPLYFEDVEVGLRFETLSRTVTEADLVAFAGVSGDFNPLHTDAVYAAGTIYGERIAHGALVLSLATGLRQRTGLFDGTLMGLLEIRSWRFLAPVLVGDTIRVVNEVTELRPYLETGPRSHGSARRGRQAGRHDCDRRRARHAASPPLTPLVRASGPGSVDCPDSP